MQAPRGMAKTPTATAAATTANWEVRLPNREAQNEQVGTAPGGKSQDWIGIGEYQGMKEGSSKGQCHVGQKDGGWR